MLKVGLTGGICSGKSLVRHIIQESYADVVCFSADDIAKECSLQGKEGYTKIVESFGSTVLKSNGEIDRKALAAIVFEDNKKLSILEKIIHPLVRENLEKKIEKIGKNIPKKKKENRTVLVEVPLLYEARYEDIFDLVVLVACTEDQQILRCQKRDSLSEDAVRQRMMRQLPLRQKVEKADLVIDNNVNMNEMRRQVEDLWLKIVQKNLK